MRILVNERLSDHRFKTPEGYLVCTDAILARTGKQTYRRGEVFGQDCKDAEAEVEVDRTEKEVFSDATLASFENKPLTVEHPDENVNAENHNRYAVGYVRDVKRAKVDGQDVMTGTLVITDAQTIQEIEDGEHTDLSCGYDCDISDEENPQQRNIRGNHVALCQQGRAGIARIIDSLNDSNTFVVIGNKGTRPYWSVITANSEQEAKDKYLKMKPEFTEGIKVRKADHVDIQHSKEVGRYFDSEDKSLAQELDDTIEKLKGMQKMKDDINWLNVKRKNASDKWLKQKGLYEEFLNKGLYKKYTDYEYAVMKGMPKIEDSIHDDWILPYAIWVKDKGQWKLYRASNSATVNKSDFIKLGYEDVQVLKNDGTKAKDSINDGYGIMSSGQEAKLRRYCDHYNVDFKKAYDELKKRFDKKPYLSIDRILEDLCDDIANNDFKDSLNDVNPREGESKDDFISRFMKETKSEYPDEKQRLAVAYSYWDKNKVMKSKGKDSSKWYSVSIPGETKVHLVKATSIEDAINKISRR